MKRPNQMAFWPLNGSAQGKGTHCDPPRLPSGVRPTEAFDTYWRFAAERQEVFFRRLEGQRPPWTSDPILSQFKFTNSYRASDRTSQYVIRKVIYAGSQTTGDLFLRILLFKLFNRIDTWERILSCVGEPSVRSFDFRTYDAILTDAMRRGNRIYSAAYIMPSGGPGARGYKHQMHLSLVEQMLADNVHVEVHRSKSMEHTFQVLRSYPSIGDFLALQYAIDINYSPLTNFSEMDFVVPGPGAIDGIRKCFKTVGGYTATDIIRMMADIQEQEFERLGVRFRSLWGRRLQLIDCQNLFCEVGKYARVRHPELEGVSGRVRIKQRFSPNLSPLEYWYPPKWGINSFMPPVHRQRENTGGK